MRGPSYLYQRRTSATAGAPSQEVSPFERVAKNLAGLDYVVEYAESTERIQALVYSPPAPAQEIRKQFQWGELTGKLEQISIIGYSDTINYLKQFTWDGGQLQSVTYSEEAVG